MKCEREGCTEVVGPTGKRYCSLSCSNMSRKGKNPPKTYNKVCLNPECDTKFSTKDNRKKYCGHSCAAIVSNKLSPKRVAKNKYQCKNTKCNFYITEGTYCSISCRQSHEIDRYLSGEIDGNTKYGYASYVKRYLEDRSGGVCEGYDSRIPGRCTETRVLTVDHMYNWRDSRPYSVRYICPTCHALTPNYAGKNRGNGRTWKKNYSQFKSVVD